LKLPAYNMPAIRFISFFKTKATIDEPTDWIDAFHLLTKYLDKKRKAKKKVVFFDELPWLSSHKSGFLKGLSYFWNSWAIHQNIVVVICGSAASQQNYSAHLFTTLYVG